MSLHGVGLRSERGLDVRSLRFWNRPGAEEPAMLVEDLVTAGRAEEATAVAEAALELDGSDAETMVSGARAWLERGELDRAQLLLTRAASADPSWCEPWRRLGELLLKRGRLERAARVLQRARGLDPADERLDALWREAGGRDEGEREPLPQTTDGEADPVEAWRRQLRTLMADQGLAAASEAVARALEDHPADSWLLCLQMRIEEELDGEDDNEVMETAPSLEPQVDPELDALLTQLERETIVPAFRDTLTGVAAPCVAPMPHAYGIALSRRDKGLRATAGRRPYHPPAPSELCPTASLDTTAEGPWAQVG